MITASRECARVLPEDCNELRRRPVPRAARRLHRRSIAGKQPGRERQAARAVRQRGVPRLSPRRPGRRRAADADARRAGAADPQPLPRRLQEDLMQACRGLAAAVALVTLAGCAGPVTPRLAAYGDGGYRYANVRGDGQEQELFVILAFSGGGTRAAAFSDGVLAALQAVTGAPAGGPARSLLEDVDVISSVSGGSFTAAPYALFGTGGFKQFEEDFLYRNIQGKLIWKMLAPWNWFRLMRSDYSRIDMAAELYHDDVFHGATFATLLERGRGRPYVLLNATDMTAGARFEFTQDQFDLLCSHLSQGPVARGVAASSAFPILLSPMTLHNYPGDPADPGNPCNGFRAPTWLAQALKSLDQPRRQALPRAPSLLSEH